VRRSATLPSSLGRSPSACCANVCSAEAMVSSPRLWGNALMVWVMMRVCLSEIVPAA